MVKIACSIVLYNPSSEWLEHLNSLNKLMSRIYVIDNSSIISKQFEIASKRYPNCRYIFNNKNLGIAGALNKAITLAQGEGFEYLLTLDQDSYFDGDSLKILINEVGKENVAIYSPFHKNKYSTKLPASSNTEEVSDVMTSGNILFLNVIEKIGLFREDYFIDYVDIEFCLRARKNNYKILRVNNSILEHNEANLTRRKFLNFYVYPPNHYPIRWYYKIRNFNYLQREYKWIFPSYFKVERKNIIKNILKVIFYEEKKIKKIKMAIKGFIDFLNLKKGILQ